MIDELTIDVDLAADSFEVRGGGGGITRGHLVGRRAREAARRLGESCSAGPAFVVRMNNASPGATRAARAFLRLLRGAVPGRTTPAGIRIDEALIQR